MTAAPRLRARIDGLIDGGCRRIIINMENASYVDSAGMGLIFSETRRIRTLGGIISLVNVTYPVRRALTIACLVDFVPVSSVGERHSVPALDTSEHPLWRRTILVDPDQLGSARDRMGELLSGMPLTPDEVFDMTLAGGEAVGNAIDHTDANGVLLSVLSYPDRVVMEITDNGPGFDLPDERNGQGAEAAAGEYGAGDERGRGIKLMRLLADSVEFSTKPSGHGTVVKLVKLTRPRASL